MLFVAMAWREKKGAGLRGEREGLEPPCMEGGRGWRCVERQEKKIGTQIRSFRVALTGGGVDARAAAVPSLPPPPSSQW